MGGASPGRLIPADLKTREPYSRSRLAVRTPLRITSKLRGNRPAGPQGPTRPNYQAVARRRCYGANQTTSFAVGNNPWGTVFDGAILWVANYSSRNTRTPQARSAFKPVCQCAQRW